MAAAPAAPSASDLAAHFLPANPLPFAVAVTVLGVAMLAYPRAALPLGAIVVLAALVADQKAVMTIHAAQAGGAAPNPAGTIPALEQLDLLQRGT